MNSQALIVEQLIHAPVHRVWAAFTDPAQLKQWYFELDDFQAEPGFRFSFPGRGSKGEQYIHLCEVKEVIPERKLRYSWTYEGYSGYSEVSFDFEPQDQQTLVRITHTGLESFPDHPDFRKESFMGGWTAILGQMLTEHLEKQNA